MKKEIYRIRVCPAKGVNDKYYPYQLYRLRHFLWVFPYWETTGQLGSSYKALKEVVDQIEDAYLI